MTIAPTFDRSKCSKRNPETCLRHRKQYRAYRAFRQEIVVEQQRTRQRQFQAAVLADLEANLKPRTDRAGNTTVSVYRSGIVTDTPVRGVETESYRQADAAAPAGRQGRMTGIFATPTMGGVARWAYANYHAPQIEDIQVRELRVDPSRVHVYSIKAWEKASGSDGDPTRQAKLMAEFWASGITLNEWVARVREDADTYDPREWELLLSSADIAGERPVGADRVGQWRHVGKPEELAKMLKRAKAGLVRI